MLRAVTTESRATTAAWLARNPCANQTSLFEQTGLILSARLVDSSAVSHQEVTCCGKEQHKGLEEQNLQVSVGSGHIQRVWVRPSQRLRTTTYPPLKFYSIAAVIADIFGCEVRNTVDFQATGQNSQQCNKRVKIASLSAAT